ncbi:MAG: hypothetical protein G01um101413_40 [Parcubacteria group bacterium Gr01-1014_13]|nr:MAG: hypothetical protein G01um101413_40 [Parcubacteria group bacterium Gr01-1014_13]
MDSKPIRVPATVRKAQARYAKLEALYPRDFVREMVKAYTDALPPPDDAVFLPDTSPEELEAEMKEDPEDLAAASPDELAENEKMKQLFRDLRGKKLSELPEPTPEEDAAHLEEEVDTAIANVLSAWLSTLHIAQKQSDHPFGVELNHTLEPVVPIRFGANPEMTWQEAPCNSISMTPEQVGKLHEAFADKLRLLIDAAPPWEGYVVSGKDLVIYRWGSQSYCLRKPGV